MILTIETLSTLMHVVRIETVNGNLKFDVERVVETMFVNFHVKV